ncbi:hypothetical protein K2X83_00225, partial [Patescibacteria group bacterium]|nr:hypothetical protein [Patescibacteria group bacterium]
RIKVLKFFTLQPNIKVSARDVAGTIGGSAAKTETEIRALTRAGVLMGKRQGAKTLYSLSPSFQYADAVRSFLDEITQPNDKSLSDAFRGVPGVTLLVATGALMRDPRPSVDLLVVTRRPKDARIERAVRQVETKASLPIRYAVFDTKEYEERRVARDRLLRDIFEFTHLVVLGRS